MRVMRVFRVIRVTTFVCGTRVVTVDRKKIEKQRYRGCSGLESRVGALNS